jgi:hypothetical protein
MKKKLNFWNLNFRRKLFLQTFAKDNFSYNLLELIERFLNTSSHFTLGLLYTIKTNSRQFIPLIALSIEHFEKLFVISSQNIDFDWKSQILEEKSFALKSWAGARFEKFNFMNMKSYDRHFSCQVIAFYQHFSLLIHSSSLSLFFVLRHPHIQHWLKFSFAFQVTFCVLDRNFLLFLSVEQKISQRGKWFWLRMQKLYFSK